MTTRDCPLGEDCDLTIAWMKGAEDARDRAKARIAALEAKLAKAVEVLKFYATQDVTYPTLGTVTFYGSDDNGRKALATLAEIEGDKQ